VDIKAVLSIIDKLSSIDIPQQYIVVGGLLLLMALFWFSEWLSQGAILLVIRLFRVGGDRGPVGRDLARRILEAAGETGIALDESFQDSSNRIQFEDMDYIPKTGTLWLTEDKAKGTSFASAGQVALEVGRALQYTDGFILIRIKRLLSLPANIAGFAWIWPAVGANTLPLLLSEHHYATISYYGYMLTAILFGFLGLFVLLRVPIALDAARRGVAAMKRAKVFTGSETAVIYLFLGIILFLATVSALIVALSFFRFTVPSRG
jgi:Zn-dependent membrane protease YugP